MAFNIFAMPSSSIVLLFSAVFGVSNALPWPGAAETGAYQGDEWSPRPTSFPVHPDVLFKRDSLPVSICGWLGGIESNAAVCQSGSSCIYDRAHGAVGCCTTDGPCTAGVYTSCVDANSEGGTTGPVVENNGVFTCATSSFCYKNSYPGNYYQWACGQSEDATTVETSYSGQPSDLLLQIVYTPITFNPTTITSTSSSSTSTSTSSSDSATTTTPPDGEAAQSPANTSSSPDSTSSTTPSPTSGGSQGVNKGVIAAGVIGTSAFLIALAGIILFFLRRRQAQQDNGSLMRLSTLKGDGPEPFGEHFNPNQGNFTRIQPYGPDDFVSPLPTGDSIQSRGYDGASYENDTRTHGYEGANTFNSTAREDFQAYDYPSLHNDVHPVAGTPPTLDMFSPTQYQGIHDRRAENAAIPTPSLHFASPPQLDMDGFPVVSEIDDFTRSFHKAVADMSPPTPHSTRVMPNIGNIASSSRSSPSVRAVPETYPGIGANMAGGIGASIIAGTRNLTQSVRGGGGQPSYSPIGPETEDITTQTAYYPDESDDDDEFEYEDGAEMKEMGLAQTVSYNKAATTARSFTPNQILEDQADPPNFDPTYSHTENFSYKAEDIGTPTAPPAYKDPQTHMREEGWVELQPTREQEEILSEETRRYQLVDRPPASARVLNTRGVTRKPEEKNKDISKGDLEL